jgi:tetratricopeptide (TPR) repeat protein
MDDTPPDGADDSSSDVAPGFAYWIDLAQAAGGSVALFCATKAIDAAGSDIEWAQATNLVGRAHFELGKIDQAIETFASIADRFSNSIESDRRDWLAKALLSKGLSFRKLDRPTDEIAVYDDLIARFGTATEPALREQVKLAREGKKNFT